MYSFIISFQPGKLGPFQKTLQLKLIKQRYTIPLQLNGYCKNIAAKKPLDESELEFQDGDVSHMKLDFVQESFQDQLFQTTQQNYPE